MSSEGSVTRWLAPLRGGDSVAVRELWHRYFGRLVGLASKKLKDAPRRVADEEDVALSAFDSFCRLAEQGRFPDLTDRECLWRLLVVITARKASRLRRDETRLKRGGAAKHDEEPVPRLEEILSREPSPEFAALAAEEHQRLLAMLGDDELRNVVRLRLEAYSVDEIADKLGVASRSIKRKLRLIRELWEKELLS